MSIRLHMQSNRNGFRMADILEDFKEFQTGIPPPSPAEKIGCD